MTSKFKKSKIASEVIEIEESKISYSDVYPKDEWHPEYESAFKVYEDLINEWTKNLYVPEALLQDIIRKTYGKSSSFMIRYSLDDILNVSGVDWKYYKKFKEDSKNFIGKNFNVFILYFKGDWMSVEERLRSLDFSISTIAEIKKNLLTCKAFCLMNDSASTGCIVVLNGEKIDSHDTSTLEQALDHELNHYFSKFNDENTANAAKIDDLDLNEKIMKIGQDAGYDLSDKSVRQDFIRHMLDKAEFFPMVSNVCNILDFKLDEEDKYIWLVDHSTSKFLKSREYRELDADLQNILLFTTICRIYSSARWHEILDCLKVQFSKKERLVEKVKCGFMTFIERIKQF